MTGMLGHVTPITAPNAYEERRMVSSGEEDHWRCFISKSLCLGSGGGGIATLVSDWSLLQHTTLHSQ